MIWGHSHAFVAACVLGGLVPGVAPAPARASAAESVALARAIHLDPGATCLDPRRLIEEVDGWLGTDRVEAGLSIEVQGSPTLARFVSFQIRLRDLELAERHFDPGPAECADLHSAVGLAIALACKAFALDRPSAGDDDSVLPRGRATEGEGWRAGLDALGGAAVLPGATFGGGVSIGTELGRGFGARLGAFAVLAPPRELDANGRGFDAWLASGRLDLCFTFAAFGGSDLGACSGLAAGAIRTRGRGLSGSSADLTPYLAVASNLSVTFELSRTWSLAIAPTLIVPLTRTQFVIRDGAGEIIASDSLPAVGTLLSIGVEHGF